MFCEECTLRFRNKAAGRLEAMGEDPRMWASTKEAFILQISLILEFAGLNAMVGGIPEHLWAYQFVGSLPGSAPHEGILREEVTAEWAHDVLTWAKSKV